MLWYAPASILDVASLFLGFQEHRLCLKTLSKLDWKRLQRVRGRCAVQQGIRVWRRAATTVPRSKMKVMEKEDPLRDLAEAFEPLQRQVQERGVGGVGTADLASACERMFPLFEYLGPVFAFAADDFKHKTRDVAVAAEEFPTVELVVQYGLDTGTMRKKNGTTRNLQGLKNGCRFVHILFCKMLGSPELKLSAAASEAYKMALEPYHILPVKLAVKAGIYTLPSREAFLARLGETETSAMEKFQVFVSRSCVLVEQFEELYQQALRGTKKR